LDVSKLLNFGASESVYKIYFIPSVWPLLPGELLATDIDLFMPIPDIILTSLQKQGWEGAVQIL